MLLLALGMSAILSIVGWATALSLPNITALNDGTMVDKSKGHCDI
jgi:hypothetical protein